METKQKVRDVHEAMDRLSGVGDTQGDLVAAAAETLGIDPSVVQSEVEEVARERNRKRVALRATLLKVFAVLLLVADGYTRIAVVTLLNTPDDTHFMLGQMWVLGVGVMNFVWLWLAMQHLRNNQR